MLSHASVVNLSKRVTRSLGDVKAAVDAAVEALGTRATSPELSSLILPRLRMFGAKTQNQLQPRERCLGNKADPRPEW